MHKAVPPATGKGARMIILGFDPGLATLGYGLIKTDGNHHELLDYGVIRTPARVPEPQRLMNIYADVSRLIERAKPESIAVEELFFNQNVTTALSVAQARGALLAAAALQTQALFEYTPLQVKQALVGYGRAEKKQVQLMVSAFLHLKEIPQPDDAADALAVAICHAHSCKLGAAICKNL